MFKGKKLIAIILCFVLIASYVTYRVVKPSSSLPDVMLVAYGEETEQTKRLKEKIGDGTISDIQTLVTSAVAENLTTDGFSCGNGIAYSLENDNYAAAGLYYYTDGQNFFSSDELQSVGFVQIVSDTVKFEDPSTESSIITVVPNEDFADQKNLICTYSYENIVAQHFVYKNYYVTYYQQTPMRVVYSVAENITSNYDFSLGSLYDFDNQRYVYDLSLMSEYQPHSGLSLFSETDYKQLEATLQEVSEQQYLNGYVVSEYRIVYISPESVQAYIDGQEEDTFYGYSTRELTEAFGYGTALTYTESGFQSAKLIEESEQYNWKSFLTKVAIGCGILIVGAILAPVTGGTSFGCALVTAVKYTVGASLSAALGTLCIETANGLIQGKSFEEAIRAASHKGLDAFANTFLVTSVIASVGVASGAIKPSACFAAGTEVLADDGSGNAAYKPIEQICVGDSVLSWDEQTNAYSYEKVTKVYARKVDETVLLSLGDITIETTNDHPFWNADLKAWCTAESLKVGSRLLTNNGKCETVTAAETTSHDAPVTVYNLEIENLHTYCVSKAGVVVHNKCDIIYGSERSKAVKEAWKREAEAVRRGISKYNWTPAQIKELLATGKIRGYEGHHILTVKELANTAKENLISSADDIVFLSKQNHLYVHADSFSNPTNMDRLLELLPWVRERLPLLGL